MIKGEKIICMPGIDPRLDFEEGYYLEEAASKDGSFFITTKEEMVNTFSGTDDDIFSGVVFLVRSSDYVKHYTPENLLMKKIKKLKNYNKLKPNCNLNNLKLNCLKLRMI